MTIEQLLEQLECQSHLLNAAQTRGFVTAMAAAPYPLDPSNWLPFLWGGEESAPFEDGEQLEQYIDVIVAMFNTYRPSLLSNQWQWPESCSFSEEEIVNDATRSFCEGLLQGWQLARDDWESIMPEESDANVLLGGVLLSVSMLYDPETALTTLQSQGVEGLDQFEEIYQAIPMMLSGIAIKGNELVE